MNKIEKLKQMKELLITIDMVNGFVKDGSLAAPSIQRVVPTQYKILDETCKNKDAGIAFIRDCHPIDAEEFKVYGKHCIEGTNETLVIDEFKKFIPEAFEYKKNSTNFMFAPGMQEDLLNAVNLERIKLMGCLSEVCVKNGAISLKTFLDQYNKNIEVCVYEDAIDTFNAPGHNADEINKISVEDMKANGIKILRKGR